MSAPDTTTIAGKIAVMAAFEAGKKVEYRPYHEKTWIPDSEPCWDWKFYDYRIAASPIAAGHNPDKLTEEQVEIKHGWRLLEPAEICNRPVTFDIQIYGTSWCTCATNGSVKSYTYRTLRPPGYFLPKTRQLRASDWDGMPVVWVRGKKTPTYHWLVTDIKTEMFCMSSVPCSWDLSETEQYEWSTDRKTWRSFTIEE